MKNLLKIIFFPVYKLLYQPFLVLKFYRFELLHYLKLVFCNKKNLKSNTFVLFTTHKCASTEMHNVLRNISFNSNLSHCNLDQLFSLLPLPECLLYYFIRSKTPHNNIIYGPVKNLQIFYKSKNLNALFILRDPRDVLVSLYYSVYFSHSLTNIKNIYGRLLCYKTSIDQFILKNNHKIFATYNDYRVLSKTNFYLSDIFISYDNLFSEKNLISQFIIQDSQIKHNFIRMNTNNKFSHLRSGESEQYLTELQRKTIDKLNIEFQSIISYFKFNETM